METAEGASSSSSSSTAAAPSERGKLFVGGISSATTEAELRAHFERFGEVANAAAIRDRATGNGRGFGFVLFSDPAAADRALEEPGHVILGRTVEVKRATPRAERYHNNHAPQYHYPNQAQHHQNGGLSNSNSDGNSERESRLKIFVGGLPSNLTEDDFRKYFEKFGTITDVVVMYDNATRRARGFGFITFESEEAVENVLQNSHHELNGKTVEVKRAVPRDGSNSNHNGGGANLRMSGGRGSTSRNYESGIYPTFGPRYGTFPGYAPHMFSAYAYGAGGYVGGYPFGSYLATGYGAPFGSPRSPWNGQGLVTPRRSPMPYVNTTMFSGYINNGYGSYMGMFAGGYPGSVGFGNGNRNENSSEVRITEATEVDSTSAQQVEIGTSDAR